ncbi:MAG: hypothetical protein ACQESD_07730, partial [Thermoplasmatota archaeon]
MKKRSEMIDLKRCFTVWILVMLLLVGISGIQTAVGADLEITSEPDYSVGDYFEYELDEDEFIDAFGDMIGLGEEIESIDNVEVDT